MNLREDGLRSERLSVFTGRCALRVEAVKVYLVPPIQQFPVENPSWLVNSKTASVTIFRAMVDHFGVLNPRSTTLSGAGVSPVES